MSDEYGSGGTVEGEAYCMKSMQKSNTDSMNKAMGYNDSSDMANTKSWPVGMSGEKKNTQNGPMSGKNNYNYNKDR